MPLPVAERSKTMVYGRSLAGIAGSNPAGAWISVFCECCVLSGRGLCDVPIPRPKESYRLWCVTVCNVGISRTRRPWHALGCWNWNPFLIVIFFFFHKLSNILACTSVFVSSNALASFTAIIFSSKTCVFLNWYSLFLSHMKSYSFVSTCRPIMFQCIDLSST